METGKQTVKEYQVMQTLVDMAAFYGSNYLLDKSIDETTIKPDKVMIFGLADILVRNGQITYWQDKITGFGNIVKNNSYIALVSFVSAIAYDIVIKRAEFGTAIKKNAIYNAIGLGTNIAVDKLIMSKEYR
jgi:hypothetical protein